MDNDQINKYKKNEISEIQIKFKKRNLGELFKDASFVSRVQKLGLRNLCFKEVNYVN